MKTNNKGFSYVEMILVLGVAAVLVTFMTMTVSMVNRNDASKGAKKIENAFNNAQVTSMAKGTDYGRLYIKFYNNKVVYYIGKNNYTNDQNGQSICTNPCTVVLSNGSGAITVNPGDVYSFGFNPSTGAIKDITYENSADVKGSDYINKISVTNKNKDFDVRIYNLTGKAEAK